MSGKLIGWAFDQPDLTQAQRLVLVAVADNASREGICFPSQIEISKKTGLARETVGRKLQELEDKKLLRREPRMKVEGRGRRSDLYYLAGGDQCDPDDETNVTPSGDQCDPQPDRSNNSKKNPQGTKQRVNKKIVTEDELTLAAAVVSQFNSSAGTALSTEAHLTPIVGRIRERPHYTEDHHRKIIEAVFAGDHWWTGPPTPKIIYGNASIFEQSIELARARKKKADTEFDVNAEAERIRREQGLED